MLIGDVNAKSKNWYCHDKSSHEGNKNVTAIENVTAMNLHTHQYFIISYWPNIHVSIQFDN